MEPKETIKITYSGEIHDVKDNQFIDKCDQLGFELISTGYDFRFESRELNFEERG